MNPRQRNARAWWGVLLIIFGALFLVQQYVPVPGWTYVGILGVVFAFSYALTRNRSMLTPAAILLGLAAGMALERQGDDLGGGGVVGGLGIGFIAIYIVDRLVAGNANWWPLIPGTILLTIGTLVFGVRAGIVSRDLFQLLGSAWPVLLILIGIILLAGQWRRGDS